MHERLERAVCDSLEDRRRALADLTGKYDFRRVRDVFATFQQRVDEARERIATTVRARVRTARERLDSLAHAYGLREFPRLPARFHEQVVALDRRLTPAAVGRLIAERRRLVENDGDEKPRTVPAALEADQPNSEGLF